MKEQKLPTEDDIYAALEQPHTLQPPPQVLQRVYSDPKKAVIHEKIKRHLVWHHHKGLVYGVFDEGTAYEIVILANDGDPIDFCRLEK